MLAHRADEISRDGGSAVATSTVRLLFTAPLHFDQRLQQVRVGGKTIHLTADGPLCYTIRTEGDPPPRSRLGLGRAARLSCCYLPLGYHMRLCLVNGLPRFLRFPLAFAQGSLHTREGRLATRKQAPAAPSTAPQLVQPEAQ